MHYKDKYKLLNKVGDQERIMCEACNMDYGVDIHHIRFRSHIFGEERDDESNLICLCRDCHDMAHDGEIHPDKLKEISKARIRMREEFGIIRGYRINFI